MILGKSRSRYFICNRRVRSLCAIKLPDNSIYELVLLNRLDREYDQDSQCYIFDDSVIEYYTMQENGILVVVAKPKNYISELSNQA